MSDLEPPTTELEPPPAETAWLPIVRRLDYLIMAILGLILAQLLEIAVLTYILLHR